ncbi:hypothetical protein [Mycetohabitans rhizoxinica]|uniref:Uncharacterized protein n=1 Tax=Mycetohabitans rhizoxinica TaxID=412963 RepID=A0ABZ2PUM1_9BURK
MTSANKLKREFVTGATPNETHYHDLIELADIGRKAIGLSEEEGAAEPGNGLDWNPSDHKLSIKLKPDFSGLLVNHEGLVVKPGIGVQLAENKVTIAVKAESALSTEGGLCVKTGNGVTIEDNSLKLHVDTDKGLSTNGGMLNVKFDPNTLKVAVNKELSINYDGTYFTEQNGNLSLNEDHIERVKKALAKEVIEACRLMFVSTDGDVGEYPKNNRDQKALAAQLQPIVDAIKRVYVTDQGSSGRDINTSERSLADAIGKLLARAYTAGAWAVAAALANKLGGAVMEASIRNYAKGRNDEPTPKGISGCVVEIAERLQNTLFPSVHGIELQTLLVNTRKVLDSIEATDEGLSLLCDTTNSEVVTATMSGGKLELQGNSPGTATITIYTVLNGGAGHYRLELSRFAVTVLEYLILPLDYVELSTDTGNVKHTINPKAAPNQPAEPFVLPLPDGQAKSGKYIKLSFCIPVSLVNNIKFKSSGEIVQVKTLRLITGPVGEAMSKLTVRSLRVNRNGDNMDFVVVLYFQPPLKLMMDAGSAAVYELILSIDGQAWGFKFTSHKSAS